MWLTVAYKHATNGFHVCRKTILNPIRQICCPGSLISFPRDVTIAEHNPNQCHWRLLWTFQRCTKCEVGKSHYIDGKTKKTELTSIGNCVVFSSVALSCLIRINWTVLAARTHINQIHNMFAVLKNSVHGCQARLGSMLFKLHAPKAVCTDRSFHVMPSQPSALNTTGRQITATTQLLAPLQPCNLTQSRGLLLVARAYRKCKFCYLMMINGVMHNHCTVHGRHKHQVKKKKPKDTWVITHAMQTKKRPW